MKRLFLKKSIHTQAHHVLKRTLDMKHLVGIGIGAMIGAGLFVLTGEAAAYNAGPSVILSFIVAAILCGFTALCYAELTAMIPISGSAYSYVYIAMGELPAWIVGWSLTMSYLIAACTVAVGWSGYFSSLLRDFHIEIPSIISAAPLIGEGGTYLHFSHSILDLPALAIVAVAGLLLLRGVRATTQVNNIMVFVKLGIIVLFVLCGIWYLQWSHFEPFIPPNTGKFGEFGISGIFRGAGVVFFAFLGFDVLATLSQEAHDPQKSIPRGMFLTLLLCTIAYVVVSFVMVGLVPYSELGNGNPIAVAVNALGPAFWWLRILIKIAILAGLFSVVLTMLMSQSRVLYIMARDGLLPHKFAEVCEKTHVPVFGSIILTFAGMLISAFLPIALLGQAVSMSLLFAFAIVSIGVLILRYREPNHPRPFKVFCLPPISIFVTITSFLQMAILPRLIWIEFGVWLAFGLLIYFCYGIRHSKLSIESKKG